MGGGVNPRADDPHSADGRAERCGTLESTLRHELLHMLVEEHAKAGTPLWFREGLVLYLARASAGTQGSGEFGSVSALEKALRSPANEQEMRQAYAEAQVRVSRLARQHGKETLVGWLQNGLPAQ
jgi:stage II sporulation protein D (peptidoglycan lytic transglycosylase)